MGQRGRYSGGELTRAVGSYRLPAREEASRYARGTADEGTGEGGTVAARVRPCRGDHRDPPVSHRMGLCQFPLPGGANWKSFLMPRLASGATALALLVTEGALAMGLRQPGCDRHDTAGAAGTCAPLFESKSPNCQQKPKSLRID